MANAVGGGFLVIRLVQLSSECQGLRLQLVRAQDEPQHVAAWYTEAHEYRLGNSQRRCKERVTDQVAETDPGRA